MISERELIEVAIRGHQVQIEALQARLGSLTPTAPEEAQPTEVSRLSPAARKRISQATKKRWAEYRAAKRPSGNRPALARPKRKLSPATKAKLIANLKKARAAKAAKAKAA